MSQITTHVLDTSRGKPAKGIHIQLLQPVAEAWQLIAEGVTDEDGRISELLPKHQQLNPGSYKMVFHTRPYYASLQVASFYSTVEILFTTIDSNHYHIPLLLSPFGYTTYRGS